MADRVEGVSVLLLTGSLREKEDRSESASRVLREYIGIKGWGFGIKRP